MKRRLLNSMIVLGVTGLAADVLAAQDKSWPAQQSLTLIVPFGPGSSPDTLSRAVAEHASKTLGQAIVVQNRPGASGNLGTGQIAKAKPDGYTFGVSITGPLVNNAVIYKNLSYDPVKELTPLTLGAHQYNVLVVPSNSPIHTLPDLLAAMKQTGSRLNFPSTGAGTVSHLAVELLLDRAGGQAQHVPYPSSPAAVASLISGDTQFAALPPIAAMPMVKDGRLRPIAAVSARRLPFLPDLPTLAELGYPGVEGSGWIGFVAPTGMPADIRDKLAQALVQALTSAEVSQRLQTMYMEAAPGTPEAFEQYMHQERQRWTPIIQRLKLNEEG